MLKTYIGPHDEVQVVIAGEDYGYVAHGETIVVDDDLANSVAWSEDLWQNGAPDNSKDESKDAFKNESPEDKTDENVNEGGY